MKILVTKQREVKPCSLFFYSMTIVDVFGQCLLLGIVAKFLAFSLDCCFDHPWSLPAKLFIVGSQYIFVESALIAK